MKRFIKTLPALIILLIALAPAGLLASPSVRLQIDVKEFSLENGMQFLIVERPSTPQVACRLAIRAGSALEERGKTGIAHMLEHMMFKGTQNFGTLDSERDQDLQRQIEAAYQVILHEQNKREPNQSLIEEKRAEMDRLRQEVQKIFVPQAFSSQLGKNGAVGVNAFTSKDQTQYMASVPADMLKQWFSIISEQLFEPAWREFYVEKEVVQREWAFRYVNNPNGAAWLDLDATAYVSHPYHNPVIGWKSDMAHFSTTDAIRFHRRYYNPSNAVCVLVGDVTLEQARQLAAIYFARYPGGKRAPEQVTREVPQQGYRRSIRVLEGARTPLVRIGFHGARTGTDNFYALDALTMILSQGRSARMTQNIVNRGLAVQARAYNPDNRYGGMLVLGGSPNEPAALKQANISEDVKRNAYLKACEELEDLLVEEVSRLKDVPPSARELARIKRLNERDFIDRMRSNEALAGTLATLEVQVGWEYLNTYLDRLAAVTGEDIRRVASRYLRRDNQTTVFVIPGEQPKQPPADYTEVRTVTGAAARLTKPVSLANHSVYPTPVGWNHPLSFERDPHKIEYSEAAKMDVDGTTVFFLPDRELPLIDLRILVKAGSVDVPEELAGLTRLLNRTWVRGGTQRYTPSELAQVLDDKAIELAIGVREEDTHINLSVLKDDWQRGLELLQEVLLHPRLDVDIFRTAQQEILTALERQGGDAQKVARREAEIWHFKGHSYGRDPLVGLKTIPHIQRDDLKKFIASHVVPRNIVIAVAGDIDQARVRTALGQFLQAFPARPKPQRQLDAPPQTPPVLTLIHKPGQVQSQVILTLPGIKRTHPDYWKLNLLTAIFGGSDSLMYKRLRDDLGLVYTAGFYQTYKWNAGVLTGYISCKGDHTGAAILETIHIMEDLRQEVPERNLELKRLDTLNSFVFNVDTPSDLVDVYAAYFLRQEPLDTLERIQVAFMQASQVELERLARQFLNPANLQIFVVGDKTIPVRLSGGPAQTLEENLMAVAEQLGLKYQEMALQ